MKPNGNLLAWIKPCSDDAFIAAFVGEDAAAGACQDFPGRAPATQLCSSSQQARRWIEEQAAALDLPLRWLTDGPRN